MITIDKYSPLSQYTHMYIYAVSLISTFPPQPNAQAPRSPNTPHVGSQIVSDIGIYSTVYDL